MNFLKKLNRFITGGFSDFAFNIVKDYFPEGMSEEQQEKVKLGFKLLEIETQREMNKAVEVSEEAINRQLAVYESSYSDLLSLPQIGRLVIFLRGCQRPAWGFSTIYMDWLWFSQWSLNNKQEIALIIINLLVLGFLFVERTIKNCEPLIFEYFNRRKDCKACKACS